MKEAGLFQVKCLHYIPALFKCIHYLNDSFAINKLTPTMELCREKLRQHVHKCAKITQGKNEPL